MTTSQMFETTVDPENPKDVDPLNEALAEVIKGMKMTATLHPDYKENPKAALGEVFLNLGVKLGVMDETASAIISCETEPHEEDENAINVVGMDAYSTLQPPLTAKMLFNAAQYVKNFVESQKPPKDEVIQ